MAQNIKITDQITEEAVEAFRAYLRNLRSSDGKITFTKQLGASSRKAVLLFSELAWLKMNALVNEYSSEIGWHGIAKRHETEEDTYVVEDILVYPQKVTGSTVTPDQVLYQNWLMGHDDEVFNNIRFQGHSHVNMACTPSTVDTAWYEEILSQLGEDMFYIFMIVNKRGEKTIKIYDMAKNLYFGTADVTVKIRNDGIGVEDLLADARAKATQEPVKPVTTAANYGSTVYTATGANRAGTSVQPYGSEYKSKKEAPKPKPFGQYYPYDQRNMYGEWDSWE